MNGASANTEPVRPAPILRCARRYKRRLIPYPVAPQASRARSGTRSGLGSPIVSARRPVIAAPIPPLAAHVERISLGQRSRERVVGGPGGRARDREYAEEAPVRALPRFQGQRRAAEHHRDHRDGDTRADRFAVDRARDEDGEHGLEIQQQRAEGSARALEAPREQGRRHGTADDGNQENPSEVTATKRRLRRIGGQPRQQRRDRRAGIEEGCGRERPEIATGPRNDRRRDPERDRRDDRKGDAGSDRAPAMRGTLSE